MSALADAWGHAKTVRMWLDRAHNHLATAMQQTAQEFRARWLARGPNPDVNVEEATAALEQARHAYVELELWLERAALPLPQLSFTRIALIQDVELIKHRLAVDITTLDALIAEIAARQRPPATA